MELAYRGAESGSEYLVNVVQKTCTCDYIKNFPDSVRSSLPANDVRLFCRHMMGVLNEAGRSPESLLANSSASSFGSMVLSTPFRHHRYRYHRLDDADLFIGYYLDTTWVNIWLRKGGDDVFEDYAFSLIEERWRGSGGGRTESPKGKSGVIKGILNELFQPTNVGRKRRIETEAMEVYEQTLATEDRVRRYDLELNDPRFGYKQELETLANETRRDIVQGNIDATQALLDEEHIKLRELQDQLRLMEEMMLEGLEFFPAEITWNVMEKTTS